MTSWVRSIRHQLYFSLTIVWIVGFPSGSVVKNLPVMQGP